MTLEINIKMSPDEFLQLKNSKNVKPLFIKSFVDCIYSEIDKEDIKILNNLIKNSKQIEIKIKNLESKNLIKINELSIEIDNFLKTNFLKLNNINYKAIIIYVLANPDYPLIYIFDDFEILINQTNTTDIWMVPATSDFIPVNEIVLGIITIT